MRTRPLAGLAFAALVAAVGLSWAMPRLSPPPDIPFLDTPPPADAAARTESAGLCPWRTPEADCRRFFPQATGWTDETLVFTRQRDALKARLGRAPTSEENILTVHRVRRGTEIAGAIVTRRVRGENGAIELVLAVNANGAAAGAKLQRLREPEAASAFLQGQSFLGAFAGRTADSPWRPGQDFPPLPEAGRVSALAILDAAHATLILLSVAKEAHLHPLSIQEGGRVER